MKMIKHGLIVLAFLPLLGIAEVNDAVDSLQSEVREIPFMRTQSIQSQADLWTLETTEYELYLDLMEGPLGKWNPDIDPLMVLGMYADTPYEEKRYARLYAQQEYELTERVLQFQEAYRAAFTLLYPNVGMIEQRLLAPYFEHELLKTKSQTATRQARQLFLEEDRLLIFVPLSCGRCLSSISHLMGLLADIDNTGVDVYIREAIEGESVEQWAREHNIQSQWIRDQKLTLNRDEGLFSRIQSQSTTSSRIVLPIFLRRNGSYFQLNAQDLGL